jgi:thiosulfate reductase cytochrome b subunit
MCELSFADCRAPLPGSASNTRPPADRIATVAGGGRLQKLAYTSAIALSILLVTSGLALCKPVQLSWLVAAFGGFRTARMWHFAAMCGLAAFIPGHLVMVALHGWKNFASMWTGSENR